MRQFLFAATAVTVGFASSAIAQTATPLSTYADKDGYLDVQALSCAQLAGTYQEDANYLTSWYSGWYNGLAKKHYANIPRAKEAEHETIVYCKEHPDEKVIKVIGRVIDEYREKKGIEVNK
jgi:HdeA/HdeB family